ncbi:mobile mystery protein A [Constantimarinum furrinae]|uniref:XRE family transcriptional regulator n=1 Tax=Constantimarinum furrinae TaxID=2562285 RepID=A0A7G8PRR8_9FLAO|nr:mobile mystery protein A [Constantimarinum furrinae]QNJ97034.1 XRE family transcriptional regulator [Constantimarinum furrinae]
MRNKKLLALKQLDRKIEPFMDTERVEIPSGGWIRVIRNSLNITLEQLGSKLGMGRTGVKNLEEREANGTITLKYLQEFAMALELKFVYGFVPIKGTFEDLVEAKSRNLAREIVMRTSHNMALENQAIEDERLKEAVEELAAEIKNEVRKSIWD